MQVLNLLTVQHLFIFVLYLSQIAANSNMSSVDIAPVDLPISFQTLGAYVCSFTRIPSTIKQFCETITAINLSYNKIEVIEATDLGTCPNLIDLRLKDNPIISIEDFRYLCAFYRAKNNNNNNNIYLKSSIQTSSID